MTRPHLDPARQTWMQAPETVAVMEALDAARPGGSRLHRSPTPAARSAAVTPVPPTV